MKNRIEKNAFLIILCVIALLVAEKAHAQQKPPQADNGAPGVIIVTPNRSGGIKEARFMATTDISAGSTVTPTITFGDDSRWEFKPLDLPGGMQKGSSVEIISISGFGSFWKPGAVIEIEVRTSGMSSFVSTRLEAFREYRPSTPAPLLPPVLKYGTSLKDGKITLHGNFFPDAPTTVVWDYFVVNPEAIVKVNANIIVVDPTKDERFQTSPPGDFVVTVKQYTNCNTVLVNNE